MILTNPDPISGSCHSFGISVNEGKHANCVQKCSDWLLSIWRVHDTDTHTDSVMAIDNGEIVLELSGVHMCVLGYYRTTPSFSLLILIDEPLIGCLEGDVWVVLAVSLLYSLGNRNFLFVFIVTWGIAFAGVLWLTIFLVWVYNYWSNSYLLRLIRSIHYLIPLPYNRHVRRQIGTSRSSALQFESSGGSW